MWKMIYTDIVIEIVLLTAQLRQIDHKFVLNPIFEVRYYIPV
jgi:hypothetical protein